MTPAPIALTPLEWTALLYAGAQPDPGLVEYRLLPSRDRHWMPYPTFAGSPDEWKVGPKTKGRANVYYGVALRSERAGDRAHCLPTHLVWAELDLKGTRYVDDLPTLLPPGEVRAAAEQLLDDLRTRLDELELTPRAIVYSGHGLQVLLARAYRSTHEDTEAVNRWLARELDGDPTVFDAARILRLPGTRNLKNPARPLDVEVWHADPTAIVDDAKLGRLEPPARDPASEGRTWDAAGDVPEPDLERIRERWTELGRGSGNGPGRHYLALAVAGWLKTNGLPERDAVGLVAELARDAHDDETPDRVRAARDTYKSDRPTRGWQALRDDFQLDLQGIPLRAPATIPLRPGEHADRPQPPAAAAAPGKGRKRLREPTVAEYRDLFAQHLVETGEYLAHHERWGTWWRYRAGVYREIPLNELVRRVDLVLEAHGHDDLSTGKVEDIVRKLGRTPGIHRPDVDLGPRELNCANGILDLRTLELRDHTPEFFSTVQTAAAWNPHATCPNFEAFLHQAAPSQTDRWVLQQYAGYCLTADTHYQVALLLIGEGGTGKGTLTRVIAALLGGLDGSGLVAGISVDSLKESGHQLEALLGKRLAIVSEIPRAVEWSAFKRVTGEDPVLINPKYLRPYSARLTCKLILLANVLPYLGEDSANTSLTRRFLPVQFDQKPSEPDPRLEARLTHPDELAGILRWAVNGLHSLWDGDAFHRPDGTLERDLVQQSNKAIGFLDEACRRDPAGRENARNLYKAYLDWCGETGHRPVAESRFAAELVAAARNLGWTVERIRTPDARLYAGLTLRATRS